MSLLGSLTERNGPDFLDSGFPTSISPAAFAPPVHSRYMFLVLLLSPRLLVRCLKAFFKTNLYGAPLFLLDGAKKILLNRELVPSITQGHE